MPSIVSASVFEFFNGMARKVFSKRQEDAIERIALGTVETKSYMERVSPGYYIPQILPAPDPLSVLWTAVAAPSGRYAVNLFGALPRNVPSDEDIVIPGHTIPSTPWIIPGVTIPALQIANTSSKQFVGNEIESRGVALTFHVRSGNTSNCYLRFSVVSTAMAEVTDPISPTGIHNTNYDWMEEDTVMYHPTTQPFNSRNVNVLKMWNHRITVDGGTSQLYRHWCPITGKKKVTEQEADNRIQVGTLANTNYYLIVEWYIPTTSTYTPSTSNFLSIDGQFVVYFKDP